MTNKPTDGSVTTTIDDGIATITFSHPAHNAMPGHQLAALSEAIRSAGQNEMARVVVLKSGGERTFCAGASFDELAAIRDFDGGKQFFMGFARVINAMRTCPKFIIGRIQGKAVGGGVGLAAATDYCIATQYASVKLSELAIGIGPFVVGPAVERKVGTSAFAQLAIAASDWQTADWSKAKGLYNDVFPTTEKMDAYVAHLARQLTAYSPAATRELKRVLWADAYDWDIKLAERAEISGKLVLSEYAKNAIAAFKAKA